MDVSSRVREAAGKSLVSKSLPSVSAPTIHVGSVEKDRVQGFPKHTRGVGLSKWTSFSQNGVESSMSQRKRKTNENSTVCTTEDTRKQKASKAPSPKSTVDNEDMHGSISDIRGDSQEANRTNDKRVSLLTQKGANDAGLALRDCNGLSDAAEDGGPKKSRFECDLMARKAQAIAHCDSLQLKHREVRNSALNQEDLAGARLADAAGEAEMILRDSISSMTQAEFNQFQDDQNPEVHLKEVLATLQKLHAQVKLKYVEADENVDLRSNGTLWLAEVNELDENIKKLQETVSDLKAKNRQDVELSVPDAVQDSRNIRAELVQARSQIEERCKKLEEKYARAKAKRQRRDARLEAATAKGAELEDADKSLAVAKKKISQGNLSREMAARLAANAVAKCKNVMLSSLESEGEIANVGTGHVDNSPPTRNHSQSSTGAHDVPALRKDTRDAANPTAPTSAHTDDPSSRLRPAISKVLEWQPKRIKWTEAEDKVLLRLIKKSPDYVGNWTLLKEVAGAALERRTPGNIKDRWRTAPFQKKLRASESFESQKAAP